MKRVASSWTCLLSSGISSLEPPSCEVIDASFIHSQDLLDACVITSNQKPDAKARRRAKYRPLATTKPHEYQEADPPTTMLVGGGGHGGEFRRELLKALRCAPPGTDAMRRGSTSRPPPWHGERQHLANSLQCPLEATITTPRSSVYSPSSCPSGTPHTSWKHVPPQAL